MNHETDTQTMDILETISDGFQAFDRQWRYTYLNRQAERILGRKRTELLGKVCWEEYPEAVGTPFHQHYVEAMETGEPRTFEDYCPHEQTWVEFSLHPSPTGLAAYTRDITERKRAEALVIGQNRILESIAGDAPLDEVLAAIISLVEEQAPGAVGSVLLLETDSRRLCWGAAPRLPAAYLEAVQEGIPTGPIAGSCGTAAYRKEPVVASDVATDPLWVEFRHLPLACGLRSCWSTPIVGSDKSILGTFAIYHTCPYQPSPREQQLVDVAVHMTRIAIERDRVEARRRAFLSEMLSSLTEGRLRLCGSSAELPEPLPQAGAPVRLSAPTLRVLRKQVEAMAKKVGLPTERCHDFITAISEAGMNAVVHAGGGEAQVYADPDSGRVQVWIQDAGGGIAEESLHRATLERGFSSAGTLGHGFWIILKTCDRLYLLTGAAGTTVVLEQECTPPEPAWLHDMLLSSSDSAR